VTRDRYTPQQAEHAAAMLEPAPALEDLAPCELVIEAAPEQLEIKRRLFARLGACVSSDCVLATNTSSLLVTALADAAPEPSRVVGMHFFNPPPVMRLLEVVAGTESSPRALAIARAAGEAMGKHVIDAVDGPGFIVNRCNRPFGLEGLRLLQERVAAVDEIDRACRLGGGFRMGPFELMDLVGVDVGLDVSRSFYEQSFGEPRWRPSPITVKMVAAGRVGRKAGRGYYEYPASADYRPPDPEPLPVGGGDGLVVIAGDSALAAELREAAGEAGWAVADPVEAQELATPFLILDLTGVDEPEAPLQGAPQAICVAAGSLAALDPGGSAVGFHALPPLRSARLVELTSGPDSADSAARATERFFATLGKHTIWVGDAPGLVLGRIVCQVVNEAAFALGEGLASAEDIDAGMVHGLSYPRGILAWADEIGLDHVLSVLDALSLERGEERYRAAPVLRRLGWSGRLGRQTGAGFLDYDAV
jgi:3-hydroxybutyryl-CoA dehydrogenase